MAGSSAILPQMLTNDVLARARALRGESAAACDAARMSCARSAHYVMLSPLLRVLCFARGGSDSGAIKDKALAPLLADVGVWYCIECWAQAAGLHGPEARLALRAYARPFAN